MPIPNVPPIIPRPIADGGDVRTIPETTPIESNQLSFLSGFPPITSNPLTAGGIPPQREDFNAAYLLLSQHSFFQQSGGIYPWNSGLNYLPNAIVTASDGNIYTALKSSGSETPNGAQEPTTSSGYWSRVVLDASQLLPGKPVILTASGLYKFTKSGFRWVTLIGGGGGGAGGLYSQNTVAGSGGGSGFTKFFVKWFNKDDEVTYTIGGGGAGGQAYAGTATGNGGNGGTTTFDSVAATGGIGALGATNSGITIGDPGTGRASGAFGTYFPSSLITPFTQTGGLGGEGFEFNSTKFGHGGGGGNAISNGTIFNGASGTSGAVIIL